MMNGIELPIGSRFSARMDDRDITVKVVVDKDCTGCVFESTQFCFAMICGEDARKDRTPVLFREVKGNSENN